jgi:hypothetical protein
MSEAIVVRGNNQAMQLGGVGMGAKMFRARPSMLELVHKSSHAVNVKYGEFREVPTNEHLGNVIRVVLLAVPQPQREWFIDPAKFSKDNKGCFSLDGIQPHPRAACPPAMYCKSCPKGDINWVKWRTTKDPKDLPPCGAYWHLLLALRATQTPHFLNIKGRSYLPFKQAMEQQMQGLLAKLMANVRAENKKRGYTYVTLQDSETGAQWKDFRPTEGFVVPEGQTQQPVEPMPNIFDISFDITSSSRDGGPFVMSFSKFALMKPEDKAEFGQLYLELQEMRNEVQESYNEEAEAEAMVTEIQPAPKGEVLSPKENIDTFANPEVSRQVQQEPITI